MHADRGEKFGIGFAEHRRGRAARREARDVDSTRIDIVLLDHMSRERRDKSGLALAAALIRRLEPIPAA